MAATAVFRRLGVPPRVVTILEGESLVNDATALVILAFALDAATTGRFSLGKAFLEFLAIAGGEIAYGVALGWAILHLRRWARSPRCWSPSRAGTRRATGSPGPPTARPRRRT